MQRVTRALAAKAHFNQIRTNAYSSEDDPLLPAGHPRRIFMERTNGFVAGDLISAATPLRSLYHSPAMKRFVGACVGADLLFEYADPLADLFINVLRPGCPQDRKSTLLN